MKLKTTIRTTREVEFNRRDIESVYIGKPNSCMCGCSGKYYYTKESAKYAGKNRGYELAENEINEKKVDEVLGIFRNYKYCDIENLDNYIFTIIQGGKQYTIYLMKEENKK